MAGLGIFMTRTSVGQGYSLHNGIVAADMNMWYLGHGEETSSLFSATKMINELQH